jgi:ketosteroid isomerase-like protein
MTPVEAEIQHLVDRETRAWDTQDAAALVDLFHPDMVWPWPPDEHAHDPAGWVLPLGRYDRARWQAGWQELFDSHALVHNRRRTVRIVVSAQGDGAFAVVDVDTLWRHRQTGVESHWHGRACKAYTKVGREWKLIMHTGLLSYPPER